MSIQKPRDLSSRALVHQVAKLHYEAELSQVDIARRLGLSTATVSRLLRRARTEGIVRIEVRDLAPAGDEAERLAARLGLSRVAVVDAGPAGLAALAGPVRSMVLDAGLSSGSVVAVGWGRAVREVIAAGLPRIPGVVTVPATGGMQQPAPHFQIGEFVRLAAEAMEGTPCFIHAPVLPSPEAREALLRDASMAERLALWDRVDAALVGIGVPPNGPGQARSQADEGERVPQGAVGDVIRHVFDADGTLIPRGGENRLIAMSPSQIRRVPLMIGIAASPIKAAAIRGAARAGLINALVTDQPTAQAILDRDDPCFGLADPD